jgi:4-hydroxy-tetrahydrodipicolinate synthase
VTTRFDTLAGIIPPLCTPLKDRDTLDHAGLERLVEHVIAGGVAGLFILGTTGEGPSLSYRLRNELVQNVCKQVNGRVPVLVGITDTSFVESVNVARTSADAGAAAVVLAPPYYMPEGQPELQEYLDHLVPELPLPLFLYNMPPLTKVAITVDTVRRAMDNPKIVGLKDSSCDLMYFQKVLALQPHRPGFRFYTGPEELLSESVLMGGHGGVSGGANLFPRLYVELYKAAAAGNLERVRDLRARVFQVTESLYRIGKHASTIIKGIKCGLFHLGICDDFMAEPFHRFRDPERTKVKDAIERLKPIVTL